jgi:hypothetical protein
MKDIPVDRAGRIAELEAESKASDLAFDIVQQKYEKLREAIQKHKCGFETPAFGVREDKELWKALEQSDGHEETPEELEARLVMDRHRMKKAAQLTKPPRNREIDMNGDKAIHGGVEDTAADTENFMRKRIAELEAENTALRELCDKADEIMERMAEEAREDDTIRTLAQALLTALEKKQYLSVPPEAWPDIAPAANALYKALGDNE